MNACCYIRVSTTEQTADNQLPAIETYCQSHGWELAEIYRENESAWKAGHQTELARLLSDMESGNRKYGACIVWSLDRVTREGISSLITTYNRFNRLKCRLISIKESFTEYPSEMTDIFLAMIGFFAKWESDRRSERTLAGLDRARSEGKKLGRPPGAKDKKQRSSGGYLLRYHRGGK